MAKKSRGRSCSEPFNLCVDDVPTRLESLKNLEQIIIAWWIVFEKIVVMPKGQQRKIKGAICNVPVDCDQRCNILPERSGIILLKLKRKIQFGGHYYFEAVRPEFIMTALNWLKANNILYKDTQIDCTNISMELTSIMNDEEDNHTNSLPINSPQNNLEENTYKNAVDSAHSDNSVNVGVNSLANNTPSNNMEVQNEEVEDPLNEHGSPANETCLQSVIPDYPIVLRNREI